MTTLGLSPRKKRFCLSPSLGSLNEYEVNDTFRYQSSSFSLLQKPKFKSGLETAANLKMHLPLLSNHKEMTKMLTRKKSL